MVDTIINNGWGRRGTEKTICPAKFYHASIWTPIKNTTQHSTTQHNKTKQDKTTYF